jgi:hypothetical protein
LKIIHYTYLLFSVLLLNSCGSKTVTSDNAENVLKECAIHYDAKVINNDHPLAFYAPSEADVKVKNDKWHLEINSMGFFHMYFVFDGGKNTLSQMAMCMDLKSARIDDSIQSAKENSNYVLNFKETTDTKMIAGYSCIRVIANKIENPTDTFSIYYTKDIGEENCNNLTPYKKIRGWLMDYRMLRLGIEMKFEATSVKPAVVNDVDFTIPEKYEIVPRDEFNTKLSSYLSGLSGI